MTHDEMEKMAIRYVVLADSRLIPTKYVRASDVAEYIRRLASTEETDIRNRLNLAADFMEK